VKVEVEYVVIGRNIARLRKKIGMTQHELARGMNLSRGSIANIETGKQRILLHDIKYFAVVLGTTSKNLMKDFD
jgi:transcriptional regulator with XRE-family HTH domain